MGAWRQVLFSWLIHQGVFYVIHLSVMTLYWLSVPQWSKRSRPLHHCPGQTPPSPPLWSSKSRVAGATGNGGLLARVATQIIWYFFFLYAFVLIWLFLQSKCNGLLHFNKTCTITPPQNASMFLSLHVWQTVAGVPTHTNTHTVDCSLTSWCQNVSINNFNFMLQWWSCSVTQCIL